MSSPSSFFAAIMAKAEMGALGGLWAVCSLAGIGQLREESGTSFSHVPKPQRPTSCHSRAAFSFPIAAVRSREIERYRLLRQRHRASSRVSRGMDQKQTPILEALATMERRPVRGFGAPGHNLGRGAARDVRRLIGSRVCKADVITPKGLDDRTEGGHVVQRAHEIAAEAWNADFCRFVTGGSTLSLHMALAAVARVGDTVLFAANVSPGQASR